MKFSKKGYQALQVTGSRLTEMDGDDSWEAPLTDHARKRLSGRGISSEQIQRVIDHGRESHQRHATIYFIGDREIAQDKSLSDCDGIHVICAPNGSTVLTAYRNKTYTEKRYFGNQKPRKGLVKSRYGK